MDGNQNGKALRMRIRIGTGWDWGWEQLAWAAPCSGHREQGKELRRGTAGPPRAEGPEGTDPLPELGRAGGRLGLDPDSRVGQGTGRGTPARAAGAPGDAWEGAAGPGEHCCPSAARVLPDKSSHRI